MVRRHAWASAVWLGCSRSEKASERLGRLLQRAADLREFYRDGFHRVLRKTDVFKSMCLVPDLQRTFCLSGYINAVVSAMRVLLDVAAGRCEDKALRKAASGSDTASTWLASRETMLEAAREMGSELDELLRQSSLPLLFLDSSPWPFVLRNVSEVVAEATGDRRHDTRFREPSGGGSWRFGAVQNGGGATFDQGRAKRRIRVWSLGLHATLAMEAETIWTDILSAVGSFDVSVESVLAQNYCNVGGIGRCTTHALGDVLNAHIIKSAPALNRVNKFPHVPDPEALARDFIALARADPGVQQADVLMCSEPPFFCNLFPSLGKPIFGYIGNPFGAYLLPGAPQENFYSSFHDELAADSRNTFACISPYLSALIYWHSGVRVPVVRPLGLYTQATYRPQLRDVMVTKQIFVAWDVTCMLNRFSESIAEAAAELRPRSPRYNATRFVNLKDLKDSSWENWARHRAVVVLPYDPQQMVFYELYGMAVPLLVPDIDLLPMFIRFGYTNLQDFAYRRPGWKVAADELRYAWDETATTWELRWWASLTDFAISPHVLRWSSVSELFSHLLHSDLEVVAARMRRTTEVNLVASSDFWRAAFGRALAPRLAGGGGATQP